MKKLNRILISCVLFTAVIFQVNSNDKIYKYLINELITYEIFSYSKLLENHNLNIGILDNKVSNVLIIKDNRKDSINYFNNGLPKSVYKNNKMKYQYAYYFKGDSLVLKKYDVDSKLESIMTFNFNLKELRVESYLSMYDAYVDNYVIKKDELEYIVSESNAYINNEHTNSYGNDNYTKFDNNLKLLEKGKMNLNFFDFLCDSYYPYLSIDYYRDSIEFKFDYDKYDSFKFAPRHQSFTKTFLNDSMAVINYTIESNPAMEQDERIYYYENGLPKLYINYVFPDQPDTTTFRYNYFVK